ncbi:hypothetical protein VHEMI07989 [[Torrubiella] hemipterigena]|uniref:Uncharacterized protein n=1 Tax=[Torrubiella] hemipterigena TaxID=1531966 RepID=A0A0A1TC29_9HYPO|nr:hypothetical protein VHEMI07989 [[Torrubiella] hemipterigena]
MRDDSPTLKALQGMYSSFRPVVTEENRRRRFRMLWPGAAAATPSASGSIEVQEELIDEEAVEEINLDEGELFSQLCTVTNVVKEGKKRGFYPSHVNISENVIRVFRRWLNNMALQNDGRKAWNEVPIDSDSILWADNDKNIGLRLHVVAAPSERMPLLSGPDDDAAVSFHIVYEELIVRTSKLLWAVEVANHELADTTGRGLIVSSLYTVDDLEQGSMQT